ncbi:hypothetical protein [Nitrosomonas ureae]|uniref:Uncharacterized protein n=1 Tax=Nitrosomonas ureae TaxID=44577 RepID=A0A0S3AKI4_9PROT|nr:hypothetical protein [Nitrosomonas ureae]ALQ51630.1 hypothetical protein ATY38_10615 [Nitrosomonas ureae]PTQ85560.1 hypothetical protein C8R28_101333 [Nitrosomonas ureae]SDU27619.1 hypothetical protein SAMN05216406_14218 [Nitrosomonas ureae]SEP84035.1 hypothetical protein SAMN05421510_100645 [Nitrosomonas ureae]
MGAIFFYIFIYFVGYYASNVLNMLTVRPFITNRYIAALLPVYGVALTHAYVIVSSPPPQSADMTVEYALLVFITLPVVIVTLGAVYFMWNSKGKQDDSSDENAFDNASKPSEAAHNEFTNQKEEIQSEVDSVTKEKETNHKM